MLLTRIYLRNFRVYEDELDLVLPPGLVGVYGPNGAGKSTLLEAITFTLWGKARTGKDEIRSAGVAADCVTEIEFEHEGHIYVVRRSLTGINSTVKAEAHCDGLIMAEGATDTRRYLHSVLGMDDLAFKASVFAEQKQLAAFSSRAPSDRLKLVLQLLGITPLDGARDAARRDARETEAQLKQLRTVLPDLNELDAAAADQEAKAAGSAVIAGEELVAAQTARQRHDRAVESWERIDRLRQARDALVTEGKQVRATLDRENKTATDLAKDLEELDQAAVSLQAAQATATGLEESRAQLQALRTLAETHRRLEALAVADPPPAPDETAKTAAAAAASGAAAARHGIEARLGEATAAVERANRLVQSSQSLSGEADCPLCGQALGQAFSQVQEHRSAELAEAETHRKELAAQRATAAEDAAHAGAAAEAAETAWRSAQETYAAWQQAARRRQDSASAVEEASATLGQVGWAATVPTSAANADAAVRALDETVSVKQAAAADVLRAQTRIEQRPKTEQRLAEARDAAAQAQQEVAQLRDKVRDLGFDPNALTEAETERAEARAARERLEGVARQAELQTTRDREAADAAARRLSDAKQQHELLGELDSKSRHLARLAALLSEFRNTVVGSVGPRLAAQAAELFGELTDHEYDQLLVDANTYELQIIDAGRQYGLDRFSGSEIDLANLALRVAISEHVRFQSGGTVGLLVLDEVFGPLDEDRKARMLQALQQLLGRFRQILVVTHDASLKDQLPNAIEVVKLPGRRATARVMGV